MSGHWRAFFAQPSLDALLSATTFSSGKTTPLWLALMGALQVLVGPDVDLSVWISNSLALVVIMVATYALGRQLFGRFAAAYGAILAAQATGVVLFSH